MEVLSFPEAYDFISDFSLSENIFLDDKKSVFVEIGPGIDKRNADGFYQFTQECSSLNLVTVGVVTTGSEYLPATFFESFDILISDSKTSQESVFVENVSAAIENIVQNIRKNPQAALVLAQLLRQRAYINVSRGLVLESLAYAMLQSGSEFKAWLQQRGEPDPFIDDEPVVLGTRLGNELDICLNRPHRANAFSSEMRDDLSELLHVALLDETVRTVKLSGAGKSFCSGGDLAEFGLVDFPPEGHLTRMFRNPARFVHDMTDRVEAYLHGVCAGAGIEIPAFASRIFADESVEIFLPEIAMGLIPGAGGTVSLPRRIGAQKTLFLAITGRKLAFEEALKWGLVDEAYGWQT